jgi:hypothetical protein
MIFGANGLWGQWALGPMGFGGFGADPPCPSIRLAHLLEEKKTLFAL